RKRFTFDGDTASARVIARHWKLRHERMVLLFAGAAYEEHMLLRENDAPDAQHLSGRFAGAEDDFREAAPACAIGIDAGKAEIDKAVGHQEAGVSLVLRM